MPFALGSSYDCVGAWIFLNSKYFHCYVCNADYVKSWQRPTAATRLPPRSATEGARLRLVANDAAKSAAERRGAERELEALHLNPEPTARDSISALQQGGALCVMPDSFHNNECGVEKVGIHGIKKICGDKSATSERGHSISTAAAIVDDFISWAGLFSNGYHRLPRLKALTTTRVFTGMMIRSLVFSLLALFCSVGDLFNGMQQTALILTLTRMLLIIRKSNLRRWDASVPASVAILFEKLEADWDDALGVHESYERVKIHLPLHYEDLYEELGTPVHWSTMHFIEALQRILKAAWRRTNGVEPALQVMERIDLGRYICGVLLPSIGLDSDPIAALAEDRQTEAYLLGSLDAIPGVNALYDGGADLTASRAAWDQRLRSALHRYIVEWKPDCLPMGHKLTAGRMNARGRVLLSRKGICAVRVPVLPKPFTDDGGAELAIFSMFEAEGVESKVDRFLVDFFISYDIRGLSAEAPNAPVPAKPLSSSELNDLSFAVDLAFGRRLEVQQAVAAPSGSEDALRREFAQAVFQRVKPAAACCVVDVAQLCQPLWAFPWVRDVAGAKVLFRTKTNKWDAEQWLVASKLY